MRFPYSRFAALATVFFGIGLQASELRRATTGDPSTLDPHKWEDPWEATIVMDLFQGLTTFTPSMDVVPGSASSWTVSEDGLLYTFQIRENLTWSDGTALSATDFEYSFRRIMDPATASPSAARLFVIENARQVFSGQRATSALGVKAVGELELQVRLEHPAPFFPELLASRAMPVPRHTVEEYGDAWIKAERMVSNGAFTLAEWIPNDRVSLNKNDRFWDAPRVRLDRVVHVNGEDANRSVRQFRAGELDVVVTVPSEQLDYLREELGDELHLVPGFGLQHFVFNTEKAPFDDVRVRRALAMAIDRELLVSKILRSGEVPAYGLIPPQVKRYPVRVSADFATASIEDRRREARKLLAEAGFDAGTPLALTLSYNTNEIHKRVAVAVSAMWKQIGVRTSLKNSEVKVLLADMRNGDFEVGRYLWLAPTSDALSFLERLRSTAGPLNQSRYRNADYDRLLEQAIETNDLEERASLLLQAERLAVRDLPVIPLYFYAGRRLVSKRVSGWVDNARGINLARDLAIRP